MMMMTGNRIPRDFFVTSGEGESDITVHAGSYHLALREAGIEMCNIITYSSILPAIAREFRGPGKRTHGEVLETIQAVASVPRGARGTAGIIYGWLWEPWPDGKERRYGGMVCEYSGDLPPEEAADQLRQSLDELHQNGYAHMRLEVREPLMRSIVPTKAFGTAGVWLCFTTFEWQTGHGL